MKKLLGLDQIGNTCVDEKTRRKILRCGGSSFAQDGLCPNCKIGQLKEMPFLDAEAKGIVKIDGQAIRDMANRASTMYILCPECGWQGYTDR